MCQFFTVKITLFTLWSCCWVFFFFVVVAAVVMTRWFGLSWSKCWLVLQAGLTISRFGIIVIVRSMSTKQLNLSLRHLTVSILRASHFLLKLHVPKKLYFKITVSVSYIPLLFINFKGVPQLLAHGCVHSQAAHNNFHGRPNTMAL